jgi:hypothetical protein
MRGGLFTVLFLLVAVPLLVLYVWALVDALRTKASVWDAAEQNQLVWVGVILFVAIVGAILYMAIARPQLQAARETHVSPLERRTPRRSIDGDEETPR